MGVDLKGVAALVAAGVLAEDSPKIISRFVMDQFRLKPYWHFWH